jgi:hypothetical protein
VYLARAVLDRQAPAQSDQSAGSCRGLDLVASCSQFYLKATSSTRLIVDDHHLRIVARARWSEVQAVVHHKESGASSVRLLLDDCEAVRLPALGGDGAAQFGRDFQLIDQWWLAHRRVLASRQSTGVQRTVTRPSNTLWSEKLDALRSSSTTSKSRLLTNM